MADEQAVLGTIETRMALLMRLGEATRRSTDVKLDRAAYLILRRLQQDGPQNVSALAAALNLDGSTVTRQLTTLQTSGLIERRPDPADGRGTVIEATEPGLRQAETVGAARRTLYGTVLRDYTAEERHDLATTLERLIDALAAHLRTSR